MVAHLLLFGEPYPRRFVRRLRLKIKDHIKVIDKKITQNIHTHSLTRLNPAKALGGFVRRIIDMAPGNRELRATYVDREIGELAAAGKDVAADTVALRGASDLLPVGGYDSFWEIYQRGTCIDDRGVDTRVFGAAADGVTVGVDCPVLL